MFVNQLRHPLALEQQAKEIEGDDVPLEHHAVDEEHGDMAARAADGAEKGLLQHHGGHGQRRVHDDGPEHVRHEVPEDDPRAGGPR